MRPALVALAALLAAPAAAQDAPAPTALSSRSVAAALDDLRLATAVRLAFVADRRTARLDVEVTARDGAVALAGVDDDPAYQAVALGIVRGVPGVRIVQGLSAAAVELAEPGATPVPIEAVEARAQAPITHRVRRGETLYGIARQYDTTLGAIVERNRLRSTTIRVGQRLRILPGE